MPIISRGRISKLKHEGWMRMRQMKEEWVFHVRITYTESQMAARAWLLGELSVSGAGSEGGEGRGHGWRSVVQALKAIAPSCREVGTLWLAHANMCSAPTCGEAASPAGPADVCQACLIQPLGMCHYWHAMEGMQLYSMDSCKNPGWLKSPRKSQRERL